MGGPPLHTLTRTLQRFSDRFFGRVHVAPNLVWTPMSYGGEQRVGLRLEIKCKLTETAEKWTSIDVELEFPHVAGHGSLYLVR